MESRYIPADNDSLGERVNLRQYPNGSIKTIVPTRNAVIVEYFKDKNGALQRVIHIECMNENHYEFLKNEAACIFHHIKI